MKVWLSKEFNEDIRTFNILIWNKKPYFDEEGLFDEDASDIDCVCIGNIDRDVLEYVFNISPFDITNKCLEVELNISLIK